jgi:hypothetical protein
MPDDDRTSRVIIRATNAETRTSNWSTAKQDYARRVSTTGSATMSATDPHSPHAPRTDSRTGSR